MRSIKNKCHLLTSLTSEEASFHILCLSETWITLRKLDLLQVDGYILASSYCRENREGGGVCILVKEGNVIDYTECCEIKNMSIEYNFEVCAIELPKYNLMLVNMYWPDSKRMPDTFYNCLFKLLEYLQKKRPNRDIVIGGDLNVNILDNSTSAATLLNLMASFNFNQHVKEPTRVTQCSATCLDHLFTNFTRTCLKVCVNDYGLSDHKALCVTIPILKLKSSETWTEVKRKFNDHNIKCFKSTLQQIDLNKLFDETRNVNANFNSFITVLKSVLNLCIPNSNSKCKNRPENKWLTRGLKISCKHKRYLKIFLSTCSNDILRSYYKRYEKVLKRTVSTSKRLHNIKRIKKSNNITKSMWNIIKEQTNKTQEKSRKNLKLDIRNSIIEDPVKVANEFNKFFSSLGLGDQNEGARPPPGRPVISVSENSMFLMPVTAHEIGKIIRNLKNKCSFGVDELPPILIKQCAQELSVPLTNLINQSFNEGTFPEALKLAIIKPVFKKGKLNDCNNYRPIAMLTTF
jgi:hypothetical protein